MTQVKIHNSDRESKKQKGKVESWYRCKPKDTVSQRVCKWRQQMGYAQFYDDKGSRYYCYQYPTSKILKDLAYQFNEGATKYTKGYTSSKKLTRFDKMEMKEKNGFRLQQNPIRRRFRKVDNILTTLLKKQGLLALLKSK